MKPSIRLLSLPIVAMLFVLAAAGAHAQAPDAEPAYSPEIGAIVAAQLGSGADQWAGMERLAYDAETGTVTYTSDRPDGPTAGRHRFEATAFIARLVAHIPDKGQVLQRYYGYYANRTRGERRWAELIRLIYRVDPLVCPKCGGMLRVSAMTQDPKVIYKILK